MDKVLTLKFEGTTIGYIKYTLKNGITLEDGKTITHDDIITVENMQTGVKTDIEVPWDTIEILPEEEYDKLDRQLCEITEVEIVSGRKLHQGVEFLKCAITSMNLYITSITLETFQYEEENAWKAY